MKQCGARSTFVAAAILLCAVAPKALATQPLKFSDLAGWWVAEPTYAGEPSRIGLHFLEDKGKQSVRLSLFAIGGYEVPIGTLTLSGNTLDMQPYPFPLTYDAARGTLSGILPEAALPIYKIPVEFRRSEALPKPPTPAWNFPKPRVKWRIEMGSPVWAGLEYDAQSGRLFVGDDDGMLHAIDARGSTAWTFRTKARFFGAGKPIKSRPAVIGDAVYVASDSGYLYKIDKFRGTQRWRAKVDSGSPSRIPTSDEKSRWDHYGSSIVADEERVYFASRDKNLYALDIETGKVRWRVAADDMMTATPVRYRDMLLFAAYDGKVRAVNAIDGKPRWTYDAKLPVAGDLTVANDRVFVGSRSYDLIALNAADGKELWKHYYWFSWIESPPVVRDQVVYTGSSDAIGVYAINSADGTLRWKTTVPGWSWARTAVDDNLVVAGTVGYGTFPGVRSGSLVALDRASGAIRWMHVDPPDKEALDKKLDWGFAASPLIVDGIVYAADLSGRVYAFEVNEVR